MILAILQARVGSSRLHGKVLKEVLGKPLIQHEIERIKRSKKIDKLVLATSDREEDKHLISVADNSEIESFAGSEDDVLDRYYQCARIYNPDAIVRLTGDMPIHDPDIIDKAIKIYEQNQVDYVSNTFETSYPDGLDTEIMSISALEKTYKEATLLSEREHVTPYIYNNANPFLSDIQFILGKNNITMLHKMKRINKFAHKKYTRRVRQLNKKYNYIEAHPSVDALQIIQQTKACISMPFTSTALMAKLEGKPSVYYDPSGLIQKDDRAAHGVPVLSNIDELQEWVKSIGNE